MEKHWKPYGYLHVISDHGDVKNTQTNRVLKPRVTREGYYHYQFKGRNKKIHRIVAELFVPNPDGLPCVNHIDSDKTNNHYSNLEWCTQSHNLKHAWNSGTNKGPSKRIRAYKDGELVGEFKSGYEAARTLGLGLSTPSVSMYFDQPMYGFTFEKA